MKKLALLLISLFAINAFAADIAKGTMLMLADGSEVAIEDVKEDDFLLTFDPENRNILVSRVIGGAESSKTQMMKITLANGSELTLVADHPLLGEKGWVSGDTKTTKERTRYASEKIRKYKVNTFVFSTDENMKIQMIPIISIQPVNGETETYSLKLDNERAAFIANGTFVGQQ